MVQYFCGFRSVFFFVIVVFLVVEIYNVTVNPPCNVNTGFYCFGNKRIFGRSHNTSVITKECDACVSGKIINDEYHCTHKVMYTCHVVETNFVDGDEKCKYIVGTYDHYSDAKSVANQFYDGSFKKLLKPYNEEFCTDTKKGMKNWQDSMFYLVVVSTILCFAARNYPQDRVSYVLLTAESNVSRPRVDSLDSMEIQIPSPRPPTAHKPPTAPKPPTAHTAPTPHSNSSKPINGNMKIPYKSSRPSAPPLPVASNVQSVTTTAYVV